MASLPTTKKKPVSNFRKNLPLHLMLLPAVILLLIFNYVPMGGIVMAFQDYRVTKGLFKSEWVGLDNFRFLMSYGGASGSDLPAANDPHSGRLAE